MAQTNPTILNPGQNDPLAALRDIRMPGPIEAWPPAYGWWLLAAIALLALVAAGLWGYRHWQRNRYRREALTALEQIFVEYQASGDERGYLQNYAQLLKLTALTHYPRAEVASLTGEAWVQFLDRSAGTDEFSMGPGQILVQANYEPDPHIDVHELHDLGRLWISSHRALPELEQAA